MGMYGEVRAVRPTDGVVIRSVSLEKAWHGLHFLLNGSSWDGELPLGFLVQGGQPNEEDVGYGPARLLTPPQVQQLNAALADVSDDQLWSRFDAAEMEAEQIYPLIWDEPEENLREEYLMYFHNLKHLVHEASANGLALQVCVR